MTLARETDQEMLASFDAAQASDLREELLRIADSTGLFSSGTRPS